LLKNELGLRALSRKDGDSSTFQFDATGEERLRSWMERNLEYSFVVFDRDLKEIEEWMIERFRPPLNLTNSKNRDAAAIKEARRICQAEATASEMTGGESG
jgi:hypothetical protein